MLDSGGKSLSHALRLMAAGHCFSRGSNVILQKSFCRVTQIVLELIGIFLVIPIKRQAPRLSAGVLNYLMVPAQSIHLLLGVDTGYIEKI